VTEPLEFRPDRRAEALRRLPCFAGMRFGGGLGGGLPVKLAARG